MAVRNAGAWVAREVSSWEGVTASVHRFGGTEFRLGRRELGHLHGDHQADIVFPMETRNRLLKEGRVEPHHHIPESGWTTFRFRREEDVQSAVELFRLSYKIALEMQPFRTAETSSADAPTFS